MLIALTSLSILSAALGLILGLAARKFAVEADEMTAEITAMMPGSNCGQCGFPGCAGAAAAIASGEAPLTCCPPGGKALVLALAEKLGVEADTSGMAEQLPSFAIVKEEICIGCTKCAKACPTDAVLGAVKQIHAVIRDACTGCSKCEGVCPTGAIELTPLPVTLQSWVWPKPATA